MLGRGRGQAADSLSHGKRQLARTGYDQGMGVGRVWLPPERVEAVGRVVFLGGPIQGTWDWQALAASRLLEADSNLQIANPRRPRVGLGFNWKEQVDWESEHLALAARRGVVMFWLARELEHNPARAYAQTSRFELGEWSAKAAAGRAKLAVGVEAGFSGERYIRRRLGQAGLPVADSLDDVCAAAIAALG